MNEHDTDPGRPAGSEGYGSTAVRLDQGHVQGTGRLPEPYAGRDLERFTDPGLPPHQPRLSDLTEEGAKRAEKQVATLFGLSMLATIVFVVAYFAIDIETSVFIPGIGSTNLSNVVLGVSLGVSLLGIGLGAIHWAKTLMSDQEVIEERHPTASTKEAREGFGEVLTYGNTSSQLGRRPLIKYSLGGALALVALPLGIQLVGGLGRLPKDELSLTYWNGAPDEEGVRTFSRPRLVRDPENTPIKATDVTIGSVFHVLPQGLLDEEHHVLEEKGKAAVLLMRLNPADIKSAKERDWGHEGIVAYSKICTHVGCPVGLYEQTTHHLLCPCHQSTFDVTNDCEVIFGPAKRPLPQLKITVDDEGYLVADRPFREAVGPSFWERG